MLRFSSSLSVAARALGLAAALASTPAFAQDCQLVVRAGKLALYPGQSMPVEVFARFHSSAHAFASAQFRVLADLPAWLGVSAGAIIGDDVLNISASQLHQPFLGVFADASNPLRIWSGAFQPASWTPRLVRFETTPLSFATYPSKLTPSTASCVADPTRDFVLVNPISVARFGVAPGDGTSIQRTGLNQFRAQSTSPAILIGLLLPAVQSSEEEPRVILRSSTPPERVEQTLVAERTVLPHPVTVLAWARVNGPSTSGIHVSAGDVRAVEYHFLRGGAHVRVFSGNSNDLNCALPELPIAYGSRVVHDRAARQTRIVGSGEFGSEQTLSVPGLGMVLCDAIEVHVVQHNLKQLAIGAHSYEIAGPSGVNVALMDGSVR
ncbi:MAG: hypothetical protein IPN34_22030 [Planctomycetes bacterium]|nr:hypothetical protein [Planctomycetota bacterium]